MAIPALLPKVGLTFTVLAALAGSLVSRVRAGASQVEEAVVKLASERDLLRVQADLEPGLRAELEALRRQFDTYARVLPPPELASEEALLRRLQQESDRAQLVMSRVRVDRERPRSQRERARRPALEKVLVQVDLQGSFAQFLALLRGFERQQQLLRVESFELVQTGDQVVSDLSRPLALRLRVATFRYPSER